jgi:hypothetical protein
VDLEVGGLGETFLAGSDELHHDLPESDDAGHGGKLVDMEDMPKVERDPYEREQE